MINWWYFIVLAPLAYWLFVTVISVLSVRKMSRPPEELLFQVSDEERLNDAHGVTDWAREQGFELDSQFDFDGLVGAGGLKLAVEGWYLPPKKIFLMHYHVLDKFYLEFVTGLEGEYSLTSSKSADSLSLPFPPRAFVQLFENASFDGLLAEHEKGLAFLQKRFGLTPVAPDRPLRDLIVRAVKTQMDYVQSQPSWQLKVGWWHLTRRRRLKNKSVIEQIRSLDQDQ